MYGLSQLLRGLHSQKETVSGTLPDNPESASKVGGRALTCLVLAPDATGTQPWPADD